MKKQPFFYLLGGVLSLMIAMGIGRFAYTPILPLMQNALSFTDSAAGLLASSNYAGYFIGAISVGLLPMNKGKVFYLRISLIISILTTLWMGLTHAYNLMLILRFISGIASAFIFVLISSIVLDKLAAAGKTNWSGLFYSGVGFGIFFSTLFIPKLNSLFEWEGVWIGLATISAILSVFVSLLLNDYSPSLIMKKDEKMAVTQVPPLKWLPLLIIAYGLEGLGYIVTGTFIVSIADQTPVFSIDSAFVWIVVGLGAIPSCIIWSELAKKQGFVKSLVLAMAIQTIGIVLPVFSLSQMSLLISALLFGATFMGITTLAITLARQMQPENSSRVIGYLTSSYAIGQIIGPAIAGIISTYTLNYNASLLGAACAVLIGAVLLVSGIRYDYVSKIKTL